MPFSSLWRATATFGEAETGLSSSQPAAAQGQYGLEILHDTGPAGSLDIVFVHGITGNRRATWTDPSGVLWPKDLLPQDLKSARILTFGYDADVVNFFSQASQNRIRGHASNLMNRLAQLRGKTDTTERHIIFVAHSLGGLVCEDALLACRASAEQHHASLLDWVKGICFLGTPHAGASKADWANIATHLADSVKNTNKDIVRVLKPDSEVLARIQQEFHAMVRMRNDQRLPPWKITCFFEELAMTGVGTIVPEHSAILPAYSAIGIRDTHVGMARFKGTEDDGYLAVCSELIRWAKELDTVSTPGHAELGRSQPEKRLLASSDAGLLQPHGQQSGMNFTGGGSVFQGNNITNTGNSSFSVKF